MTTLHRMIIPWTGAGVVGLSATVLHWDGSDNAAPPVAAVQSAFSGVAGLIPIGTHLTIPTTGDSIDDTTGALTGVWSGTGGGDVAGAGPANFAAGVGACVGWSTGGIVTGTRGPRKLRGRTFIVPLHNSCYDVDGTFTGAALTQLRNFANALQAAGPLAIWHRPTSLAAANGNSYGVIANKVNDKVAYLSSRRS